MGIIERKKRASNEIRDKILQASQRIIVKDGFRALSMRRIAETIEYSPTTIYLYFKNREAIVSELGRMGLSQLLAQLESVAATKDPLERLQQFAAQYQRFSEEHTEAYRLIFMENADLADAIFRSSTSDEASNAGARAFGYFVQAFAELKGLHPAWAKYEPVKNAEAFWATLHGIAALKATCGKFLQTDSTSLIQLTVPALLAGLATSGMIPSG